MGVVNKWTFIDDAWISTNHLPVQSKKAEMVPADTNFDCIIAWANRAIDAINNADTASRRARPFV